MSSSEVFDFLTPNTGDPLQISFFALILLMMGYTVISTHINARPASWEKKWNRGTPDDASDDLDIEHGSVTDLWHAVATASEKLAEVMPSLLLVVGLLGTFLGLGLALNHASNILGQANALSASGAASSIQDLLGLLQGLGTKFKTSTWGITGFVLLKIWSELTRFEEKRLIWVIDKVKSELERRKQEHSTAEKAKQEALFLQIDGASDRIVKGFAEQIAKLMENNKMLHTEIHNQFEQSVKGVRKILEQVHVEIRGASDEIVKRVSEQTTQLIENNKVLHGHTLNHLDQSVKDVREILEQVHVETRGTSDRIVKCVSEQTIQLIESNKVLHGQTLSHLDKTVKGVSEILEQVHVETRAMNLAMLQFTESTRGVVENMAEAAQRMAKGADKIGDAAKELVDAIDAFKNQFTDVLDNVRKDLGEAIHGMSDQASETLERGSAQLGAATQEISVALGKLSSDVKETMSEVKGSINKALDIQQRAANEFTLSSIALNENIATTTGMVDKLSKPIEDGLRSVSESGQHMRGIGNSLIKSISSMEKVVAELDNLHEALAPLKTFTNKQQDMISALDLLGALPALQQAVLRELQGLSEQTNSQEFLDAVLSSQQAVLGELQGIREEVHSRIVVIEAANAKSPSGN